MAGKSASSSVPEDLVPRLRASGGKATKAREAARGHGAAAEAPSQVKPKPKAAPKVVAVRRDAGARCDRGARWRPQPAVAAVPATPAPSAAVARRRGSAPPGPGHSRRGRSCRSFGGRRRRLRGQDRARSPADIVKILFMAGEMVTATTSLSDEALQTLGPELGYRRGDRRDRGRAPGGGARGGGRRVRLVPRRRSSRSWATSTTARRSSWTRSATRRRLRRVRRHHPAHRRLPGPRQRPGDHVHRHPRSRGVHRDAGPWRRRSPTSRSSSSPRTTG